MQTAAHFAAGLRVTKARLRAKVSSYGVARHGWHCRLDQLHGEEKHFAAALPLHSASVRESTVPAHQPG